eukprot:COSAG04_NODE_538_length_12896_cov_41.168243_11_plen_171_part_00
MQKLAPRGVPCLQVDCSAGRGDHYIEHGGYTWRTLDGADPQGGDHGAPNGGCQGTSNYLALPAGWVLAPNDATSIAVVAAHGWSTYDLVVADGTCWYSANYGGDAGDSCGSSSGEHVRAAGNHLATCQAGTVTTGTDFDANSLVGDSCPVTSGGTYTVSTCNARVLARCG